MKKQKSKSNKFSDINVDLVLSDAALYSAFKDWSIANLCSENLLFYVDVEEFKKTEDIEQLEQQGERIFEKFVKDGAYNQINLDHETRQDITRSVHNRYYHKDMFKGAQYLVMDLIKYDLLVKFAESDIYREYKGNLWVSEGCLV